MIWFIQNQITSKEMTSSVTGTNSLVNGNETQPFNKNQILKTLQLSTKLNNTFILGQE